MIDNDVENSPFNSSVEDDGNDSDFGDNEEDLEEDDWAGCEIPGMEDNVDENREVGTRKRKKKSKYVDPTKRRRIRRILREDQLQSKTLEAQQEEKRTFEET